MLIVVKRSDVVSRVAEALSKDTVRFSDHAMRRMDERHQEWNYAFRGKTVDAAELRVSVALKVTGVLVITVINLELR